MSEQTGKKPEDPKLAAGKFGIGLEKEPEEVSGRFPFAYIRCWNCKSLNYVDMAWDGFVCRVCGTFNAK